ncbi:hypothetical protein GINT2_001126 [Glugoides intestinalis]
METMVSSSNNIEQVTFLWQKLIWSKQPEGLFSTKSLIVISIVIFLIMTLRNGRMYYNNLLSGFLTILLTIISGIIFGKGLEILFRTLHIICSGAYGNVVFSLADIFISLLFGCIFVSFGYCLLFNKKLYKLLRLQTSEKAEDTELAAKMADKEPENSQSSEKAEDTGLAANVLKLKVMVDKYKVMVDKYKVNKTDDNAIIVDGPNPILEYIELIMGRPELNMFGIQNIVYDFNPIMDELKKYKTVKTVGEFKSKCADFEEPVIRLENVVNRVEEYENTIGGVLYGRDTILYGLDALLYGFDALLYGLDAILESPENDNLAEMLDMPKERMDRIRKKVAERRAAEEA